MGVRINELEVSVGAIDRERGIEISKATVCSDPITLSFWLKISHSHAYAYYFCLVLILSGCGGKGSLANGVEPRGHSLSTKRSPAPNVFIVTSRQQRMTFGHSLLVPVYRSLSARLPQNSIRMAHRKPIRIPIKDVVGNG